jgi:threonine dehydratase
MDTAMIDRAAISLAHQRLRTHLRRTPVVALEAGAFGAAAGLVLKLEHLQHAGSFKCRGALHRALSQPVPPAGVLAASGGNHGAAVAWVARRLGCRAEIFVPEISTPAKVERIRGYGAAVTVVGRSYAEALAASQLRAAETGALVIHAYDQPEVVAGQGTLALELEEQAPGLDAVLVPVGGGGLLGGIAAWFEGRVRVIGVEPARCPTLTRALEAGAPVDVEVGGVAADSLGARRVGALMFELSRRHGVSSLLVDDDAIVAAQKALWRELRLAVEPGAAAALAAILSGAYRPAAGERVGVILSGANADPGSVG